MALAPIDPAKTTAWDEKKARLLAEINFWDNRANVLKDDELSGKVNARLNSGKARQRAEDLAARLGAGSGRSHPSDMV